MKRNPALERLRDVPPFDRCTERELRCIDHLTCFIEVRAGTVLCRQGSVGRETFFIAAGEAVVTVDGTIVAELGRGDVFGEMAVIDGARRAATVVALTTMEVFVLSPRELETVLAEVPRVARSMLAKLSTRLRLANVSAERTDQITDPRLSSPDLIVVAGEAGG